MVTLSHSWALLLALPALWLLWMSRRRSIETHAVANLFLWHDAPLAGARPRDERRAAPPWLAWLQAAVLVAIAVAIAAPSVSAARPDAALIVDLSTSMSARDGSASRLELAKAAAKGWLNGQSPRHLIRVIGAGPKPELAGLVRGASPEASAAIDRLAIQPGGDNISGAVEAARRESSGPVMVISDRGIPAEAGALGIEWTQVGTPVDNVAITAFTATRGGGAVLEVSNFGQFARRVDIEVAGGALPWQRHIEIGPMAARSFVLASDKGRTLTASLRTSEEGDAIAIDDRRRVDVGTTKPRVALVIDDVAVRSALEALPDIDLDLANNASTAPNIVVTSGSAARIGVASLIFRTGGTVPAITRRDVSGVRTIDVAVDLAKTEWTLTPAFPIFVADSVDWLSGRVRDSLTAEDEVSIAESNTRDTAAPYLAGLERTPEAPAARGLWFSIALVALVGVLVELVLRRRAIPMRAFAAATLGAALVGMPLPLGGSSRAVAIALDSSASVAGNQRKAGDRVRRETAAARSDDRATTVRFGGAETDIAAGLRDARAALPPEGDRRILLVSDGQQTTGDSASEARNAKIAGVPVDVVSVDSRVPAYIARVDAPALSRAGAPVPLRVSVNGSPNELLHLTITRDGRELDSRRVVLNDAGEARLEITDRPTRSGVTFYRVSLADERLGLSLSESGASTTITGSGKVLVISDDAAPLLPFGAIPLDLVVTRPSACPDTRDGLAAFSAVVIDSVPPHRLSTRQLDAIASAVSLDGTGLLFLGSRDSLDASEFPPGPFSDALPIDFTVLPNPPATSASLALLVDISGSMASTSDGVTKIDAARDAIARALAIVPKSDAVEVLGFSSQPVLLIGPNDPRDAASVTEKLKSLSPSGSTALAPAVAEATAWLTRSSGRRRRLLLVTDGKTSVSDAQATRAAVAGQSVEVSVVTIGNDAERDWLTELAASTGGRAYFPDRLTDLAREVAREASRGSKGREVDEPFVVRAGSHPLAPADPAPALGGYIAGRLREGATAAWKARTDDAVLAAWPRGIGRVAVFASDIHGPWGAPLKAWRENASFWRRAIEWIARGSDPAPIEAALENSNDGPRLVVDLGSDNSSTVAARALPSVRAAVAQPGGQTVIAALHPVSPTRFEGPIPLGETGDYRATISVVDPANGLETRASRGWYWTGDRESASRGANVPLLEEIARSSGGRMLPALGAPVADSNTIFAVARARRPVHAEPWWLFAALAMLSFDYIRRAATNEVL
jgi:hypothetical protein